MVFKLSILLVVLFSILSNQTEGQNLKKTRLKKEDKKRQILMHYIAKDTAKAALISLKLFRNNSFEYSFDTPFDEPHISRGKFTTKKDTLILQNDLDLKILPIGIEYKETGSDDNCPGRLCTVQDETGRKYRTAMVWINNQRMGCMGGIAVCVTGPGFEKIDSVKVQIGNEVFSDWIPVVRNDKKIQVKVLSTLDLTNIAFLGPRKYVKQKKNLRRF